MTTTHTQSSHLAYDEASTPHEMYCDCEAASQNIRVPEQRIAETVTSTLMAAPKKVAAPVIAVTDRLAKMAGSLFD